MTSTFLIVLSLISFYRVFNNNVGGKIMFVAGIFFFFISGFNRNTSKFLH